MVTRLFRGRGPSETAEDPVCHMQVDVNNPSGGTHEHESNTYYFCGTACRNTFVRDPESFLSPGTETEESHHHHDHGEGHQHDASPTVDGIIDWGFEAKVAKDLGSVVDVEYACVCGCRPGARYALGGEESGSEHCCCGRVHFAGKNAEEQIHAYMDERAKTNMDEDVGPYTYRSAEVVAPSGETIPVAYAQPDRPRK